MKLKSILLALAACGASAAMAATTYIDVSDATDLVAKLRENNGKSSVVLRLAEGTYNLPSEAMATNATYGLSSLYVNKVQLLGMGATPDKVVLKGTGNLRAVFAESTAKFENLTIEDGNPTVAHEGHTGGSCSRGGGIYGNYATVTNCIIRNCKASHGGGATSVKTLVDTVLVDNTADYGGALFNCSATACTFTNNVAKQGGACWVNSTYTIKDCTAVDNRATDTNSGVGGAFWQNAARVPPVTNCLIVGNSAMTLGGGCALSSSVSRENLVVIDCTIVSNTAATHGGGVYNATVIGGTIGYNETGSSYEGGGAYMASVEGCTLIGNIAQNGGGASACSLTDCTVVSNTATYGGGVYNATATDCTVFGNTAQTGGGVYKGTVRGGTVANNEATVGGGGGVYQADVYDSMISNNVARGCSGGGLYPAANNIISNSTVYANRAIGVGSTTSCRGWGAGIYCGDNTDAQIVDCEICGNYAVTGSQIGLSPSQLGLTGGVHGGTLRRCTLHDNYADSLAGACRNSIAYDCRLYNNYSGDNGHNGHDTKFFNCTFSDSSIYAGAAVGCTFRGYDGDVTHTLTNNPFKSDFTYSKDVVWSRFINATNCLVVGNKATTFFSGTESGGTKCSTVNCTFADNQDCILYAYCKNTDVPFEVVNCAYANNTDAKGASQDLRFAVNTCFVGGLTFSHCLYGTTSIAKLADYGVGENAFYQLGTDGLPATVRFNTNGPWPYEPRCSSPLVGRGLKQDWMTGANDIRNDPQYARLRNDKVDIGCYQCWLNPQGLLMLFK